MSTRTRLLLLFLLLAAYGWRVAALDSQSLWRDEVDAIYFATRPLPDTLSMFVRAGQNGPLYFLALRPWFNLVGTHGFALRYISVLAGVLSVALLWQVARKLAPPKKDKDAVSSSFILHPSSFLAALFFAFNPYQLWYSQEGKMYALLTALVLLATWFWVAGITRGGWRPWFGYWLTLTIGLYSHLLLILIYPLHLLWFFIAWPASRYHWRGYGLALAGLVLPYLPMVWWQWDLLTAGQQMTGFSFTPFVEMLRSLLLNHSRGFMPPIALVWLAPLFFLGGAGLVLGIGEIGASDEAERVEDTHEPVDEPAAGTPAQSKIALAPWRRYLLIVTWLFIPILSIYLLSLRQPIFTDRYVIWVAPAAMLVLALGVQVVRRYAVITPPLLAAALVIYVLGLWLVAGWQQMTQPMKYDLRAGVAYIEARRGTPPAPDSLLILQIPHMELSYRYYTSDFGPRPFVDSDARLAHWVPGLWTNNGWPDATAIHMVDEQMRNMTAGVADIWLLRSEVEMWDQRRLMDAWLDSHGEVIDQADFNGVQVRHYKLKHGE